MPSKAQRAAARQAKLRQKKKRGKGSSQVFDPGPAESKRLAEKPVAEVEAEPQTEVAASPAVAAPAPARASRRSRQPAVPEAAPVYTYLGGEVRRIGVITVGIAAIIFALTFVMGA